MVGSIKKNNLLHRNMVDSIKKNNVLHRETPHKLPSVLKSVARTAGWIIEKTTDVTVGITIPTSMAYWSPALGLATSIMYFGGKRLLKRAIAAPKPAVQQPDKVEKETPEAMEVDKKGNTNSQTVSISIPVSDQAGFVVKLGHVDKSGAIKDPEPKTDKEEKTNRDTLAQEFHDSVGKQLLDKVEQSVQDAVQDAVQGALKSKNKGLPGRKELNELLSRERPKRSHMNKGSYKNKACHTKKRRK